MVFNTDAEINTDANVHTRTHVFCLCLLRGPGSRDTLVAVSTSSNRILVSKFCSALRGLRREPSVLGLGPELRKMILECLFMLQSKEELKGFHFKINR